MSTLNDQDRENLTAYLDGELDEETAQALEAKINLDPGARKEVDALKQAWGMLDFLPRPQPSSGFTNRTMERLSMEKMGQALQTGKMRSRRVFFWSRVLGWTAGVVIAAGLGVGAGQVAFRNSATAPRMKPSSGTCALSRNGGNMKASKTSSFSAALISRTFSARSKAREKLRR